MIEIIGLSKNFSVNNTTLDVLNKVSLKIEDSDIFGIIGFSGAGKSTLLRILAGIETSDSGKVIIDGLDILNLSQKASKEFRKNIRPIDDENKADIITSNLKIKGIRLEQVIDLIEFA